MIVDVIVAVAVGGPVIVAVHVHVHAPVAVIEGPLRIRWERRAQNYLALVEMSCAFIAYRAAVDR